MSKVDPTQLNKLDRKSTILLQAARSETENAEKSISGIEDPGIDTLRGSFGAMGSIIRARSARRMSKSSGRVSRGAGASSSSIYGPNGLGSHLPGIGGLQRHQLYDPPVPNFSHQESTDDISLKSQPGTNLSTFSDYIRSTPRTPTIKFETQNVAHYYPRLGTAGNTRHEHISAGTFDDKQTSRDSGPPLPPLPPPTPNSSRFRPQSDEQTTPRQFAKANLPNVLETGEYFSSTARLNVDVVPEEPATAPAGSSRFVDPFHSQHEVGSSPSKRKNDRKGGHRHYPRSNNADDTEETIALVDRTFTHGDSDSVEPSDSESILVDHPGVRLVGSGTVI